MNIRYFFSSVILTGLVLSCSEEAIIDDQVQQNPTRQEVTVEATLADGQTTKTSRKSDGKIYWSPADEINVFFGNENSKFTSKNTEDALTAAFSGMISGVVGMNEGGEGGNYMWGLYPYNENATFDGSYVHTSLSNVQKGVAGTFADDLYITLAKNNSFSLSFFNVLAGVKFSVQKEGVKSVTFSGNNGEILTGNLSLNYGSDARPNVHQVTNGATKITLTPQTGTTFTVGEYYYIVFVPTTFTQGFTLTFKTATETASFVYSKNISFARNTFGTLANADKDLEYEVKYEYVDLGLSVKWATFNVGATKPEEYGDYFAWGETEPYYEAGYAQENPQSHWKSGKGAYYSWSTYKYCNGSMYTMTKYCTASSDGYNGYTDNKTVLDSEDDAAHVNWGGSWRMPTKAEFQELIDNCTWTWEPLNGVNGYKVQSNISDYTDKWIFLPAAGIREDTNLIKVGSNGRYWSSSLDGSGSNDAYFIFFGSDRSATSVLTLRYYGQSVRPVYE